MQFRRLHLALSILLLTAPALYAQGQKPAAGWTEWETISPEGEEFTVSMPKNPTTESATFPYHKMELSARLYLAKSPSGPVLAIASLSGIKSNPAAYSDFARFNSYIDAFKDFFPPRVRKDVPTKLTLVSSRPFNGHTGRSYKMTIGDLTGSVQAYVTRKRFYAIVSLNTKKDEALDEKFLSSFVLPERQIEQPKVTAAAATAEQAEAAQRAADQNREVPEADLSQNPNLPNNADQNAANNQQPNTGQQQQDQKPQQPNTKRPIAGGMLNAKAIYLPLPEAPAGDATGVVLVAVIIDEQGTVIEARAVSGPQNLHVPAVSAARLARFSPTLLMGEPVRVSGTLSYNFVKSN
jgi:Gram-negative bacterial TonB protein C-terminal